MAYGTVYVFNLYSATINSLTVNSFPFTTPIAGPIKKNTKKSPYTPYSVAVPRTNLTVDQLNSAEIVVGVNTIVIHYEGDNGTLEIELPDQPYLPLEDDLWLYLGYETASLYETSGTLLPNPNPPGTLSGGSTDYLISRVATK